MNLSDIAPHKRGDYVGMWCRVGESEKLWILADVCLLTSACRIVSPTQKVVERLFNVDRVTIDLNLPRAWEPDGTPVKGWWELGTAFDEHGCDLCITSSETQLNTFLPSEDWDTHVRTVSASDTTRTGVTRRWVTAWQPQPKENEND